MVESVVPSTSEQGAWQALVDSAKGWAEYLDQWNKFKFETPYGPVYVTIGRADRFPDSFDQVA